MFSLNRLWLSVLETFVKAHIEPSKSVYLAIDRTTWGRVNLLMVSLIWQRRAIPVYWRRLGNLGNSCYADQTTLLAQALSGLAGYRVVVLGDREFCSVELARWLSEQGSYFCLRVKASTYIRPNGEDWISLAQLGLGSGMQCFFNPVTVTKCKGFGAGALAGKWKRRYRGFAPDEPWFILTNLETLDEAIAAYQKRFGIEEMFRDLKSGGYWLEACRADGKRFESIVLLVAIAYTCATTQGQLLKGRALQKYIARPEQRGRTQKRHSAFHLGLTAHRWAPIWFRSQPQVQALLQLNRNKIADYLRGMKAVDAVLSTL